MIAFISIAALLLIYVALVMRCSETFRTFAAGEYLLGDTPLQTLADTDIIVAAKNEEQNVDQLAQSINGQTHPKSRLIFVDDHSTDNTASRISSQLRPESMVISSTGHGKKDALRDGIAQSRGKYILSTDADCFPRPRWAELMVGAAMQTDADMVMAPVIIEPIDRGSLFQRLQMAESFAMITITGGTCLQGSPVMCNGGNIGYRASFLIQNTDGLNSRYASGDDMFMMEAASKQKRKFAYVRHPDAVIRTNCVPTLGRLMNQRARWVSKTGGYTSWYILFFAFAILLGNVASIAALILACIGVVQWWLALPLLLMKFLADYQSVMASSTFYGEKISLWDVIVLEAVYPYYVLASVAKSMVGGFVWK